MMHYLLILLIGYLLGCSNMAVYLAAAQNVDLRSGGSGNPGASNALILMGWRAGLLVGAHDIAKAVLAVLLCRLLFPAVPLAGALSGAACVVGHMFPFFRRRIVRRLLWCFFVRIVSIFRRRPCGLCLPRSP